MNFKSHQEYLQEVLAWKQRYAEISNTIRASKAEFAETNRAGQYCPSDCGLRFHRQAARELLEERTTGKIEAQRQYLTSRSA